MVTDSGKPVEQVLEERGARYGKFEDHAEIVDYMLSVIEGAESWYTMKPDAKQAIRVICDKIARILNGDPEYDDNWRDIAGYATLVLNRIEKHLKAA